MAQKQKLEQTKGGFKLRGIVVGLNEESVREGETKKEVPYKSIRFGVKTSPTNTVYVELFGMEKEVVKGFNRKWEELGVDKIIDVDWDDRHNMPQGYALLGTNLTFEKNDKGKGIRKVMVEMDAIDYLSEHLENDMSVYVSGTLDFSEYENQQGEVKEQTRYNIGNISVTADIDFEDENFEELCSFHQDIVVSGEPIVDKKAKKVHVPAFIIDYKGNAISATFTVDGESQGTFANNVSKRLGFGDLVSIYGEIKNGFIAVETAEEVDEWGGKKPNGYKGKARENISELRMTGIAQDDETGKYKIEAKKYKQEDFEKEEAEQNFGGKPNPFADDDSDDLPF